MLREEPKPVRHDSQTFAESDLTSIYQCSSGCLHLQIGSVNLTLTAHELADVATVVLAAMERLHTAVRESDGHSTTH